MTTQQLEKLLKQLEKELENEKRTAKRLFVGSILEEVKNTVTRNRQQLKKEVNIFKH